MKQIMTTTVVLLILVFVLALIGCSGDAGLNPQSEPGTDMQAQTTLDLEEQAGGANGFSRYGIGLPGDLWDGGNAGDIMGEDASSDSTANDEGSPD